MPLTNFGVVTDGLTRSAQPTDSSGYNELVHLGVTRIYKLDKQSEYSIALERKFFPEGEVMDSTVGQLFPSEPEVRAIVASIQGVVQGGRRAHVHCVHGTDRTGLICAAYQLLVLRMPIGAVLAQRSSFGTTWYGDVLWDHNIVALLKSMGGAG